MTLKLGHGLSGEEDDEDASEAPAAAIPVGYMAALS